MASEAHSHAHGLAHLLQAFPGAEGDDHVEVVEDNGLSEPAIADFAHCFHVLLALVYDCGYAAASIAAPVIRWLHTGKFSWLATMRFSSSRLSVLPRLRCTTA